MVGSLGGASNSVQNVAYLNFLFLFFGITLAVGGGLLTPQEWFNYQIAYNSNPFGAFEKRVINP